MKLQDILVIMQNRLNSLNEARKSAVTSGNIEQLDNIDSDTLSTIDSIQRLKSNLGVD